MKQRATLPVPTSSVTSDTRAIVRPRTAVSAGIAVWAGIAVRAGLLVVIYAGRMFRMMTFIILACQSDSEKPEAGSLA
jgi:hypothetical protein